MKKIFVLLVFCFVGLNIYSQQNLSDELKVASQISNSNERLNAYDRILEKYGLKNSAGTSTSNTGKWTSSVKVDPITDSKVITFILRASSGTGVYGGPISLVIRWDKGNIEMYINWNSYLGSSIDITFRIGDKAPETKRWQLSTDSQASFYPSNQLSTVQSLLGTNQAIARCTPYNESPITATFDITGLKEIATQYNNDLKWF